MNVVRWSPFREFDDFFRGFAGPAEPVRNASWVPPADVYESDSGYHIDLELPAISRDDVSVLVKDGVLSVSGERKSTTGDARLHRAERVYGAFERRFRLPENADEQAIEATASDGVLRLVIGKREQDGPRRIEVQVH